MSRAHGRRPDAEQQLVGEAARILGGDDVAGVLGAAAEAAGARLTSWRRRSLHRRGTRSVSGVYEVELRGDGWRGPALLVAHVDRTPPPVDVLQVTDGDLRIAVWRFPQDPYLPGLASAVHRPRVREVLDRLGAPAGDVAVHTRAYRPSRRAVVEVVIEGGDVRGRVLYLKVLAGDRAGDVARIHRQLAGIVPVPAVLGVAGTQGIVALEALPGRTLRTALVDGDPLPEPAELVELSRRLADSGLRSRRAPAAFADPTRHVALLTELAGDQRTRIEAVAAAARDVAGPRVPVHGDLHDGQLLCDSGAIVGLLDVDGAGAGMLAHDAGSLIAHLEAIGEVWPDASDRAREYASAVADAYRPLVGGGALASAAAGAWLGLATGPYRAQDDDWPDATRRRIARGATWARRATG